MKIWKRLDDSIIVESGDFWIEISFRINLQVSAIFTVENPSDIR